jgi:hypothetical protein
MDYFSFLGVQNAVVCDLFAKLHELGSHSVIAQVEAQELDYNNAKRYKNSIKNALRAVRQYNDECDVGCLKEGEIIDQQTYSRDFPSTGSVFDFGVRKNLANPKIDQLSSILKKREEKNIPLVVTRVKWNDEKSNCSLVGDYRVLCYIPEQDWIEIQLMSPVDDLGSKCKISSVVIDAFEKVLELLRLCVVFLKTKRDLEEKTCHRYKLLGFFQILKE